MDFWNVLDKLEKLRIIEDADTWTDIRELRNKSTNEYPNDIESIKQNIRLALQYVFILESTIINIEKYLEENKRH